MKEFTFNYFAAKNSVAFDDFTVKIKIGPFRKMEFPFGNLQNFYVFNNKDYRSIYFVYTANNGKNKRIQVFATPAEMGFDQLVAELQAKIPQKSLNHLSEKEAFAAMHATNPKKWAPIAVFFIMFAILSAIFYPQLRHYFDFGFANATVEDVGNGKDVGSRNICVTGTPLDQTEIETTTSTNHGVTTTSKSSYIPLVGANYKDGDPVKVMLKFNELSDDQYQAALADSAFTGVIRNIAWEGLGNSQIDFFKTNFKMNFPSTPVLIEITNEKHNDVYAIWIVAGVSLFLGIIVLFVALKKR